MDLVHHRPWEDLGIADVPADALGVARENRRARAAAASERRPTAPARGASSRDARIARLVTRVRPAG